MLYVDSILEGKYNIYDTEIKYYSIYTYSSMRDRGVVLKGCGYVWGTFTVSPVPLCYGNGLRALAEFKMLTGY